ncbi:tRNA dihydrouridine synthase DusB [Rhodovibrionaceae bacterium A322]
MSITVGDIKLDSPVVLAPMSGVTDLPFRRLVKRSGVGLVVSEMIASQCMIRASRQSMKMSTSCAEEFPMAVQLAGADPEVMAEAARLNVDRGAAIIDINFGCPVKKVVNRFAGSAIMKDEVLAGRIMEAVVKAVPLPVTMKMRLGWDKKSHNAANMARIAKECGIQMLTVHGRTRCQLYNGRANWRAIREVKEATDLPLLVNGDIDSYEAVDLALEQSGADGVMIGRGAYGRPWFLSQVMHYLETGKRPADPDLSFQLAQVEEHYDSLMEHFGEELGVRISRKHLGWYVKGFRKCNEFRQLINRESDPKIVRGLLRDLYAAEGEALAA